MDLDGELTPALVAVSGGLGDIGQAIARAFRGAGAEVALGDLAAAGEGDFFYAPLDVTDAPVVGKWFDRVTGHFGRAPNVIVPNAATATLKRHFELTPDEWKRELDVNLNGAYYFADAGASRMLATGVPGRIVFLGSWAGHAPHAHLPAYSVAKAGLRMLTQTLALELAPRGILVNEVAPGYVHAGLSGKIFDADPGAAERARARVPARRLISADEVARQILFLCSPDGRNFVGSTLLLDGGLSLLQGNPAL